MSFMSWTGLFDQLSLSNIKETIAQLYLQIMLTPSKMYVESTTEPRYKERMIVIWERT